MFAADVWLALVGCLVFPLVFLANVIFQRYLQPLATRAQQLRADVSEVAHESFDGALVVKTLGRESAETERFRAPTYALRDANIAVNKARGMFDPVIDGLPRLGVLGVLLVGVYRVSSGGADAGDVVQVAFLFTLIGFPIRALGWVLGELPRSVVGWDRIQRVLTAEGGMEYGDAVLTSAKAARLQVADVRFGYLPERDVLAGVDFVIIEPGRTVAMVGPTGSGKSTMTTLLTRLIDPEEGAIKLDGVDLRDLARDQLAGSVALVAQTAFLFDDTIRGNITLGGDYSDEDVWDALRIAQGDGFVKVLPHGLDTKVGERGTTLSGGQRQRIALARALVRRPRLLILDDATSAVDPQVEARILAGLRSAVQGAEAATTVLVIAYRKATISLADEVLFLDEGRIAAQGTHTDLQETSAAYRNLVDAYEKDAERRQEEADLAAELDDLDSEGASA